VEFQYWWIFWYSTGTLPQDMSTIVPLLYTSTSRLTLRSSSLFIIKTLGGYFIHDIDEWKMERPEKKEGTTQTDNMHLL
jgi:hypothetical protein